MDTEINTQIIIGHIAGLSEINKDNFINMIKNSVLGGKVNIIDLDKITNKITNDEQMGLLYNKYNELSNELSNDNKKVMEIKIINSKMKEIEKKMNMYWKSKMEYNLMKQIKILSSKDKYILLVGYISFFKNHRIYLNLNLNMKFFIKVDSKQHTKEIITYNLDNFREEISNGNFDLNYLNPLFLTKKRTLIMNIYNKLNYINLSLDTIINVLEVNIQIDIPKILYFVSDIKYDKKIPINNLISNINNFNTFYNEEWLALTSPNIHNLNSLKTINMNEFNIIKGITKKKSYIKINNNIIKIFKNKFFLYEISNTEQFIAYPSKNNIYKYITSKPIKYNRVLEINNLYNQIIDIGIDIIKI
jgi:hypothetical protein